MTGAVLLLAALVWAGIYGLSRRQAAARGGHWPFAAELVAATGLLALSAVGFFWQILLTPNTWMPAGGGDLAPFLYPNYQFAAHYLRQGDVPLWNPHLYSGVPFAADIQSGLFYPINLLVFLLVPTLTYEWLEALAIFHFWLAGSTMYLFLRSQESGGRSQGLGRLSQTTQDAAHTPNNGQPTPDTRRIHPLAAFAGALAFQFSDLFIVHFGNLNMIAVAAWLPLVLLLFQQSLRRRRNFGWAAAAGVVLAVATLAGHIQITLFILLTLGLYALFDFGFAVYDLRIASQQISSSASQQIANSKSANRQISQPSIQQTHSPHSPHSLHPFLALLVTLLVMVGLSALLLLPAFEMSRHTPRAQLPYEEAAAYSLHPVQMVGLLVPNYFGRDPALHWGPWERVETGYIGLMTLLLAIIGLALTPGRLKGFFALLALLALLLAMGGYGLLHGWLYAIAPGFNQLRAPARFILLLDFALAALAALGLDALLRRPWPEPTRRLLPKIVRVSTWILGGLLVVAAPLSYYAMLVTQDRDPSIFNRAVGAATGVAIFALFAIAALVVLQLISSGRLRGAGAGLAVIAVIGLDLFTLGHNVDVGHSDPTAGYHHPEAIAFLQSDPNAFRIEVTTDVWHAWQPDTAMLNNLYDVWGLYNPLTLADTTLYWSGAPPRSSGRYNFLGAKYIIASKAGAPADGDIVPIFDADPQVNIYLNQSALARVLFVGHSRVMSHDAAWQAIRAKDFDPARTVILEGGEALDGQPTSELALLEYGIERVTVSVSADQPGYLVLSDAFYPGWQATVNGQPAVIERANYAFRAVQVPAGQHTVQFLFSPTIWRVGLASSGITLLALLVWAGWGVWRKW